jgi:hypothetical protein
MSCRSGEPTSSAVPTELFDTVRVKFKTFLMNALVEHYKYYSDSCEERRHEFPVFSHGEFFENMKYSAPVSRAIRGEVDGSIYSH